MMNYYTDSVSINGDFVWGVFERPSGLMLRTYTFAEDADRVVKTLNKGAGFDGWTPPFFTIDTSDFVNINDEFEGFIA